MASKIKLREKLWQSADYYEAAMRGSTKAHPGMVLLQSLAKTAQEIIDLGCGEGTRLDGILKPLGKSGTGVDISGYAIRQARRKYSAHNFMMADLEKLPFKAESFDLAYCAFVLEHTEKPQRILKEAVRILKRKGKLVVVCPNFGAPNRASPNYRKSRLAKLISGFLRDLAPFGGSLGLSWNRVSPKATGAYFPDSDTTVEPYLRTLLNFLRGLGMKMVSWQSCWDEELKNANIAQRLFRFLGDKGIYPFTMWGPHILVFAQKEN